MEEKEEFEKGMKEAEKEFFKGCGFATGMATLITGSIMLLMIFSMIALYTCAKGIEKRNEQENKRIEKETKIKEMQINRDFQKALQKEQQRKRNQARETMPTVQVKPAEEIKPIEEIKSKEEKKQEAKSKELSEKENRDRLRQMEKALQEARLHKKQQEIIK